MATPNGEFCSLVEKAFDFIDSFPKTGATLARRGKDIVCITALYINCSEAYAIDCLFHCHQRGIKSIWSLDQIQ
jgi:hypothetical protein